MITPDKVKSAIYALLCGEFPELEIHTDLMPANFTRPALFLELYDIATRDVNRSTIEELLKVAVTCLVNLDEYGNSADNDLSQMSERVRVLFRDGAIYVEDRAVRCAVLQKKDADMVRMELTISYWEQRSEASDLPTMGSIEISNKQQEGA